MKKPWFRASTGEWYVTIGRRQIPLGKDAHGAERKTPPPAVQKRYFEVMGRPLKPPEEMTLGELSGSYLERMTSTNDRVVKTAGYCIGKFVEFVGPHVKVKDLRPYHLTRWVDKRTWKPSTIRSYTDKVLNMMAWAAREGHIEQDPITSTKGFRRLGYYEKASRHIPDDIADKLIEGAAPELRACLVVLRDTGMRPIELCRARIEKYDPSARTLAVPNKAARVTATAERTVWLTERADEVVRSLIGERVSGFIFRTPWKVAWTPSNMAWKLWRLKKRLGIDTRKYSLYSLRHTLASNAINRSNANPALIARLLGHTDLKMLLKHYLETDPDAMRKAAEEVAKKKGGSNPPSPPSTNP